MNIISSLDLVNAVIGVDLLSQSLLPAIVDLAEDPKWRVRLAIIENIPMLGEHLGKVFFSEKLNNLCLTCLSDDVYSVRRLAAGNLEKLCKLFGEDWCCTNIIPRLLQMHSHTNYLQRMTSLYGAQILAKSLSPEILEVQILPMVLEMTGDPVPNVRFTVAKTFEDIIGAGVRKSIVIEEIETALHSLSTDADKDVRFFAMKVHYGSSLLLLCLLIFVLICRLWRRVILNECLLIRGRTRVVKKKRSILPLRIMLLQSAIPLEIKILKIANVTNNNNATYLPQSVILYPLSTTQSSQME